MKYSKQKTVLAALILCVAFSSYAGTKAWVQIKNESSYTLSLSASQSCISNEKNGAFDDQTISPNSSYPAQDAAEINSVGGSNCNGASHLTLKMIAGRDKYASCTVYMHLGKNVVDCRGEGLKASFAPDYFSELHAASTQGSPIIITVNNR